MKIKFPQVIYFTDATGDKRPLLCIRCKGSEWEYGGQNCTERVYQGGEMDGLPYEECTDIYRCTGCTRIIELNPDSDGYHGPEWVEESE